MMAMMTMVVAANALSMPTMRFNVIDDAEDWRLIDSALWPGF
jgi:hypothetical protein